MQYRHNVTTWIGSSRSKRTTILVKCGSNNIHDKILKFMEQLDRQDQMFNVSYYIAPKIPVAE
jgi:hypothetical protein